MVGGGGSLGFYSSSGRWEPHPPGRVRVVGGVGRWGFSMDFFFIFRGYGKVMQGVAHLRDTRYEVY